MKKKISIICVCAVILFIGTIASYCYSKPKISVVMSTYNRAHMVPKAIDSILKQTFQDFEFIIIDDGSSDATADILKKYADQDHRIRVLTNTENKGLIYSLNRGLDAARGEFIARMDDDDISLPLRFEKQYNFMRSNPTITATSSFVGQPENAMPWPFQRKTDSDEMKTDLFLGTIPVSHPSLFIRRDFLTKNQIRYNDKYEAAEDGKFYLDLYDAGAVIGKVPEILVLYRMHQDNPQQWYEDRWNNTNLFIQNEILPRFDMHDKVTTRPPCDLFRRMIEINKTKMLLPQEALEEAVEEKCPTNPVDHPYWKDNLIFKENRACRMGQPSECGIVRFHGKDSFTIKWDHWGVETFIRKADTWKLQKPVKGK